MNLYRHYPPYEGREPYLFLCFSDADAARVKSLLEQLYERGCRVWYSLGKTSDIRERSRRQERMQDASLTVLYLTDHARNDVDVKSAVLFCQAKEQPIICVDTDLKDRGLSMGLTEKVRHISSESELIRTEGFSQELVGPPIGTPGGGQKKVVIILVILAVILIAGGLMAGFFLGWFHGPEPETETEMETTDTVSFSDQELTEAVREAVGGGVLTPESLSGVVSLHLTKLPEDKRELSLLPSLSRLEIPQAEAFRAAEYLDDYTVVLYGEEMP